MSESWIKETCPNCNWINWIYLGNMEDETQQDVDGWKCYKCEQIHIFGSMETFLNIHNADVSVNWTEEEIVSRVIATKQVRIEDGLERPR